MSHPDYLVIPASFRPVDEWDAIAAKLGWPLLRTVDAAPGTPLELIWGGPTDGVGDFVHYLEDHSYETYHFVFAGPGAADRLAELRTFVTLLGVEEVIAAIQSEAEPARKQLLVRSLAQIATTVTPAVVGLFDRLFRADDEALQVCAIQAATIIGSPQFIPLLNSLAERPGPLEVRVRAVTTVELWNRSLNPGA